MIEFLQRNTLPLYQERLDLAASQLNEMEDILCKAINELAGRVYIINNMIPEEERDQYATDTSSLLLSTIASMQTSITSLSEEISNIRTSLEERMDAVEHGFSDLETRLNNLDDAAARKEDVNVILYRTGE